MTNNLIEKKTVKNSIFIVGKVIAVEGRLVKVSVNKNKNGSHIIYNGDVIKSISVGSYVKIAKGFIEIIGKVEGEYIKEEKYFNKTYSKEEGKIDRVLQISLFGHIQNGKFLQGIKEMPLIDNECYLLDKSEFNSLHQFYLPGERLIKIGMLSDENTQPIELSIDKLFASHIGIFGNTGSGKSNTLAKLYHELFSVCSDLPNFSTHAKFIFIDFNGEYSHDETLTTGKKIYKLDTETPIDKFPLSVNLFKNQEIIGLLLEATEKTQKPFLNRALRREFNNGDFNAALIINELKRIAGDILDKNDQELGTHIFAELFTHIAKISDNPAIDTHIQRYLYDHLQRHSMQGCYKFVPPNGEAIYSSNSKTQILEYIFSNTDDFEFRTDQLSQLIFKIIIQYYDEIVKGYSHRDHISPLIGRMFKKFSSLRNIIHLYHEDDAEGVEVHQIMVISLKNVNMEMKKILPLIICKTSYDTHKESTTLKFLNIIIDEAHNILSTESERESEIWKDYRLETFEEIIKEGRKFGTFLTIASQRPYDISPTIVSQLHNYFIHRLINNNDIEAVRKTVAYLDKLSFDSIPILPVGSCFIAGSVTDIPIKVEVSLLDDNIQPKSETLKLIHTCS